MTGLAPLPPHPGASFNVVATGRCYNSMAMHACTGFSNHRTARMHMHALGTVWQALAHNNRVSTSSASILPRHVPSKIGWGTLEPGMPA